MKQLLSPIPQYSACHQLMPISSKASQESTAFWTTTSAAQLMTDSDLMCGSIKRYHSHFPFLLDIALVGVLS
jgi:hypothetical protein